jgi:capsular polysaccharide transport system permease protein
MTAFGAAAEPLDPFLPMRVVAATLYLAIGIGAFGVVLITFQPVIGMTTIILLVIGMYLTSGAIVPLNLVPPAVQNVLWYNPLYQAVALLRSCYFYSYDVSDYSIFVILFIGSSFLLIGLLGERLLRGRLLAA